MAQVAAAAPVMELVLAVRTYYIPAAAVLATAVISTHLHLAAHCIHQRVVVLVVRMVPLLLAVTAVVAQLLAVTRAVVLAHMAATQLLIIHSKVTVTIVMMLLAAPQLLWAIVLMAVNLVMVVVVAQRFRSTIRMVIAIKNMRIARPAYHRQIMAYQLVRRYRHITALPMQVTHIIAALTKHPPMR